MFRILEPVYKPKIIEIFDDLSYFAKIKKILIIYIYIPCRDLKLCLYILIFYTELQFKNI